MSHALIYSRTRRGVDAPLVQVEVHLLRGIPKMVIVGLPETAIKESRDRVKSALISSGFEMPVRHIVVNLSPADLPKEGSQFDLAIAIGILAASGQVPAAQLSGYEFVGELGLSGDIRPIQSILPFAMATRQAERTLFISPDNAAEASIANVPILAGAHLLDVCAHLNAVRPIIPFKHHATLDAKHFDIDLSDIRGQPMAKRALEIAAAGGHSLLMQGPPGTGKSMLAQRLPTLLPLLTEEQALTVATLYSISKQGFNVDDWRKPPFRAPHHTASITSLVGGGSDPKPGEISLAHHGVLFLDELPEFPRKVIEGLREPLESRKIHISRVAASIIYPAHFQMICAMNPCPCGFLTDPKRECRCSPQQIENYTNKISGPLLDRIDMHIEIARMPIADLLQAPHDDMNSHTIRERVDKIRQLQYKRQGMLNTELNTSKVDIQIVPAALTRLQAMVERFSLSARTYHRLLKLSRTIADLQDSTMIEVEHISEAIGYRMLDTQSRTQ